MVATRLRLLSLLTAAVVIFGACSNTAAPSGSAAASGSGAASACAGTGTAGGATELQIPDVVAGKFNVAMVLIGPHDDGGWSQAHYEGLQYVCENVPDAHVAYIELVPEGADSEQVFRSLVAQGLQLHHRHVVRVHGPDGDGRRGIPRHHVPAPDRLQVQRQELRQLLRRDGGLQVPRRDARRIARQEGRQSRRSATWRPSRSRRSCASATRSCSASSRPAPNARWTSASSTPGTTRSRRVRRRPRCSTPAREVVFTGADTPAVADVAQEKGKWAVTYDHPTRARSSAA